MSYLDKQHLKLLKLPELTLVDYNLRRTVEDYGGLMTEITKHILSMGGKRIRPALVITAANIFGAPLNAKIQLATVAELIHTASLLHDDVIDDSNLRRGQPTANNIWGNSSSVLAGDYLFAQAFNILSNFHERQILSIFTDAIAEMCNGELRQSSGRHNLDIDLATYLRTITGKTASLIGAACETGALISPMPRELVPRLRNYGINLGCAYQIIDDICDYTLTEQQSGKPWANDIKHGVMTSPLIFWLEDGNTMDSLPTDFSGICNELKNSGALRRTRNLADNYLNQAMDQLDPLPECPAIDYLRTIVDFFKTQCQV